MTETKTSFWRNHADTIAIIGVNIAIGAILVTMFVSSMHRIDAANARIDSLQIAANARMDTIYTMFYDLLKEVKK